ncbi:MAG: hypothetical protein BZ138_02360, partial [Methanosphaera sp. rholeuAM270]
MNYKKIDIFSPLIFVVLVLIYMIFSEIAFKFQLKELTGININTIYIIFLGILFYLIGFLICRYVLKNREFTLKKDLIDGIFSEKIVLSCVFIGIFLQILNLLYLGGIPLFSGYLKAHAATRIWLFSYLIFLPSINIL